jgi:hypothetical protein
MLSSSPPRLNTRRKSERSHHRHREDIIMLDKAPTGKVSDLLNAPTRNGELTVLQRDYVHDYAAGRGNPRPFCCLCSILSPASR